MTAALRWALGLWGGGLLVGFALVVAYFGTGDLFKRHTPGDRPGGADAPALADLPKDRKTDAGMGAGGADTRSAGLGTGYRPDLDGHGALDPLSREEAGLAEGLHPNPAENPRLDIVHIQPSGDTVMAGRAAPNAVIEVLRDNQPVARVQADSGGQFALDPFTLPSGNSELSLRVTGPDGKSIQGRENVEVVIAKDRKAAPLVAISEPDKPTRVLSQPDSAGQTNKAVATAEPSKPVQTGPEAGGKARDQAGTNASTPVKIVSVDAQEGGRLHVTGKATAWSSLRLYLNDTMVASGQSDAEGRIAFTIGRGVKAGAYQIRVDQVDAQTGKVRNRAQVAFAYPPNLADRGTAERSGNPGSGAASASPARTGPKATLQAEATPRTATKAADEARVSSGPAASSKGSTSEAPATAMQKPAPRTVDEARTASRPAPDSSKGATSEPPVAAMPKVTPKTAEEARLATGPALASKGTTFEPPAASPNPRIGEGSSAAPKARPGTAAPALPSSKTAEVLDKPDVLAGPKTEGIAKSEPVPESLISRQGSDNPAIAGNSSGQGVVSGQVFVPEINTSKIIRGDNLWMISKRNYGSGLRYTVIYDANQDQIRNPNLIYPGQIFVLPQDDREGAGARAKRG